MTLRVSRFEGSPEEWDAVARSRPGGTFCHAWGWQRVMERVFGHECTYLAAADDAGLRGLLPLVWVRSRLFGRYLVSMPFLNYGGPVGDAEAVRALAARAVELADEGRVKLLELRSRVPLPLDLEVSHRKITVLLDIPSGDPDLVFKALPAKLRSQVRRPQKEGVTVRFGQDQVQPFFRVFARNMRDLGTPTQSLTLFHAIAETFGDDAWFGCAYLGQVPVAAGAGFRWGAEFEMTWASALKEYKRIAPNMLLYWSFMERCAEQGVGVFNFGRCTPGAGTHRFKRQWGGRDEQLWWYQHARNGVQATPSPDSGAYALGPRLWRRLPLSAATWLGPRIVRGIP